MGGWGEEGLWGRGSSRMKADLGRDGREERTSLSTTEGPHCCECRDTCSSGSPGSS